MEAANKGVAEQELAQGHTINVLQIIRTFFDKYEGLTAVIDDIACDRDQDRLVAVSVKYQAENKT